MSVIARLIEAERLKQRDSQRNGNNLAAYNYRQGRIDLLIELSSGAVEREDPRVTSALSALVHGGARLTTTSIHRTPIPITAALRDFASQEACDGGEYDLMVTAADYIEELERAAAQAN